MYEPNQTRTGKRYFRERRNAPSCTRDDMGDIMSIISNVFFWSGLIAIIYVCSFRIEFERKSKTDCVLLNASKINSQNIQMGVVTYPYMFNYSFIIDNKTFAGSKEYMLPDSVFEERFEYLQDNCQVYYKIYDPDVNKLEKNDFDDTIETLCVTGIVFSILIFIFATFVAFTLPFF